MWSQASPRFAKLQCSYQENGNTNNEVCPGGLWTSEWEVCRAVGSVRGCPMISWFVLPAPRPSFSEQPEFTWKDPLQGVPMFVPVLDMLVSGAFSRKSKPDRPGWLSAHITLHPQLPPPSGTSQWPQQNRTLQPSGRVRTPAACTPPRLVTGEHQSPVPRPPETLLTKHPDVAGCREAAEVNGLR